MNGPTRGTLFLISSWGLTTKRWGQYDKAEAETREALRVEPTNGNCYGNLMGVLVALNRTEEAKSIYQQALERKVDNVAVHWTRYGLAFVENDVPEMQSQAAWGAGKPGVEDIFLADQADTEAYFGRIAKSRELSRQAAESARLAGNKETAAVWWLGKALREAEFGNTAQAKQDTASALALASGRNLQIMAALALARVGEDSQSQKIADKLASSYPFDTILNLYWLPVIRAALDLNRHNPTKAVEILQTSAPYELGSPSPYPESLYPIYLAPKLIYSWGRTVRQRRSFRRFWTIAISCRICRLARSPTQVSPAPTLCEGNAPKRARPTSSS